MSPSRSDVNLTSDYKQSHYHDNSGAQRENTKKSFSSTPSLKAVSSTASSLSTSSNGLGGMGRVASEPSLHRLHRKNVELLHTSETLCIAQRSGAGAIRSIISRLDQCFPDEAGIAEDKACMSNTALSAPFKNDISLPIAECNVLAFWACDPYYRVLISASGGISAIIRVMSMCPQSADLQTAGCEALANLSLNNGSNQYTIMLEGGLSVIASAMRNHPVSITVQSTACDALRHLISIVHSNADDLLRTDGDIIHLLEKALSRVLPSQSREGAEMVLNALESNRNTEE